MQFWDDIVNTAMIGTDKKQPDANMLPLELAEQAGIIQTNAALDKEESFLQLAAVALNYRQSGSMPVIKEGVDIETAPVEEKNIAALKPFRRLKTFFPNHPFLYYKYGWSIVQIKNKLFCRQWYLHYYP